jgi:hypothetical protein
MASATGTSTTGCKSTTASASTGTTATCNIALTKSGPALTHIGDVETYNYTVTTTGNLPVTVDKATGLTDDKCAPAKYQSGDTDNDGKLEKGESWAFTCDYTVLADHVDAESNIVNTATVVGTLKVISYSYDNDGVARSSTSGGCSAHGKKAKSSTGCGGGCSAHGKKAKSSTGCGGGCSSSHGKKAKSSTGCGGGCSGLATASTFGGDTCTTVKTITLKATAKWKMRVAFPGIDVTKSATPASVKVGGTIAYKVDVKNTGDIDLTVTPKDVGCTGFDATPFALAVGATKSLTCTHVATLADGSIYHNEACATGVDAAGGMASDCDHTDTPIDPPVTTTSEPPVTGVQTPGQVVLGERITPGTARLLGRTGCASTAFNARIRGTKIARVVFSLDGKTLKRLAKPNLRGSYAVRINPKSMRIGIHRLVATVTFKSGSGTKAKKLRLSFQRCARALADPRFTG